LYIGYDAFIPHFSAKTFVLKYLGLVLFAMNILFWKYGKGGRRLSASRVDLVTGRREFEEVVSESGSKESKVRDIWRRASVLIGK
jgi:amino acid transporter